MAAAVRKTRKDASGVRVVLNGVRYLVRYVEIHGLCDPPSAKRPEITIDQRLKGKARLNAEIHESTHALKWNLTEAQVEKFADDMSELLWKLGYRKRGEK